MRVKEGVLRWLEHVERMENGRVAKRFYVGECTDSHSEGRTRKRWINAVHDFLNKRGLDVRQAR